MSRFTSPLILHPFLFHPFLNACCQRFGIKLEAHPVCQTRQIVKKPYDMGHFQTGFIIESQIPQRLPILFNHPRGIGTELLCQRETLDPGSEPESSRFKPKSKLL